MTNNGLLHKYKSLINILFFVFFLYLFFVSIELMGTAFKGLGKGFAERLISTTNNPFVGMLIGLLTTSIVQSSSLTMSIMVGMVATGTMTIRNAMPFVMGANIGTTITNTVVSLAHITRKEEFGRAFASAIVHDLFNILSVLVVMPVHLITQFLFGRGLLQFLAEELATVFEHTGGMSFANPLKTIVDPAINLLFGSLFPLVLRPFVKQSGGLALSIFTLLFSLLMLFVALTFMVKFMRATLLTKIENLFDAYIFKTPIRGFAVGTIMTGIIQSSSVTTSLVVPLVGANILTIEQVFPYFLGANIGTTITSILASLVTGSKFAITVAFAHTCFNIIGSIVWYPLRRIPIAMAKKVAEIATKSRKTALIYIIALFYVIPGLVVLLAR